MKQILKFHKNNEGASVVLALYFLLICTVISSLIILSGTVAGGSTLKTQDYFQEENISSSILKIVSREISGKTFTYDCSEGTSYFEQRLKSDGLDLLNSYVAEAFEIVSGEETYIKDFEIKIEKMGTKIDGTFSMNMDYEIQISFNQIAINIDGEVNSNVKTITFYPVNIRREDSKIIVKMGDGELI